MHQNSVNNDIAADVPLIVGRMAALPSNVPRLLFGAAWETELRRIAGGRLVRSAIRLASPSMSRSLELWLRGEPLKNSRALLRIAAYVLRMGTRTTPFGQFASVSMVRPGESTTLSYNSSRGFRTRTRPDMEWLLNFVRQTESEERQRNKLTAFVNDLAADRGKRTYVPNVVGADDSGGADSSSSSFRTTPATRFVREAAAEGLTFGTLTDRVSNEFDVERTRAAALVERLWQAGFLHSNLRPSPSGDPAQHVGEVLKARDIELSTPFMESLELLRCLDERDVRDREPSDYDFVEDALLRLCPEPKTSIQVDMAHESSGTIGRRVIDDARELASLLSTCAPAASLRALRNRFVERYEGNTREVPLLELADPDIGLGAIAKVPDSNEARDEHLVHMVFKAHRLGSTEVELLDTDLEKLTPPTLGPLPRAFEFSAVVVAGSLGDIGAGNYLMRPGSVAGMHGVGRSLARFADILNAEDSIREVVRDQFPGEAEAEIVYLPLAHKGMNVAIRPRLHRKEVQIGVNDRSSAERISATDLVVGIESDQLYVRSRKHGRLRLHENHLLNAEYAGSGPSHLLAIIARGEARLPREFSWGAASTLPFLPRLRRGRLVVSLARWQFSRALLGRTIAEAREFLSTFRTEYNMPAYVSLAVGDNVLPLDLDSELGVALLLDQLRDSRKNLVVLKETLQTPADATWFESDLGRHFVEFVFTFLNEGVPDERRDSAPQPIAGEKDRTDYPGGRWLYYKLQCRKGDIDDILLDEMREFVATLRLDGLADQWFFVRYGSPSPHIRVRIARCGSWEEAAARFNAFCQNLCSTEAISSFSIDAYERELERYGFDRQGYEKLEELFSIDSDVCVNLLSQAPAQRTRGSLSYLYFLLLEAFGSKADARAFLQRCLQARHKLSESERKIVRCCKTESEALPLDPMQRATLSDCLSALKLDLTTAHSASVLRSILHMHFNRIGVSPPEEPARIAMLLQIASEGRTDGR
jgi:lantibiotic biosynthesis protein